MPAIHEVPHRLGARAQAAFKPEYRAMLAGLLAEIVFAALPLLVVSAVMAELREPTRLFASPEWSFAAAILFGQSIVRFMTGFAHGGRAKPGPVALAVSLVIVLGLTPSLMVLSAILRAEAAPGHGVPGGWIVGFQVLFFAASVATYLLLSSVGEAWRLREERAGKHHQP